MDTLGQRGNKDMRRLADVPGLTLSVLVALGSTACSTSSQDQEPPALEGEDLEGWGLADSTWQEAARRIAEGELSDGAFSLLFLGPPDDGDYGINLLLYPEHEDRTCDFVGRLQQRSASATHWSLDVEFASHASGTYSVRPTLPAASWPSQAAVAYLRLSNDARNVFRHIALDGVLELTSAGTTLDEWKSSQISVTGYLEFPIEGVQEVGCAFGGDDSGNTWRECECQREGGESFLCAGTDELSCCFDLEMERIRIPVNTGAIEQCSKLCGASSIVYSRYCDELE